MLAVWPKLPDGVPARRSDTTMAPEGLTAIPIGEPSPVATTSIGVTGGGAGGIELSAADATRHSTSENPTEPASGETRRRRDLIIKAPGGERAHFAPNRNRKNL